MCTLGNLAVVDEEQAIRPRVPAILGHLEDASIVLQGHAVRALTKIARAMPDLAPRVLDALVGAADRFPGSRVGYVVEAMGSFGGDAKLAAKARRFAEPYAKSDLEAVATKARKALKSLSAGS